MRSDLFLLNDNFRDHKLCESRDGRPGLPVPNSSYGLCGRKATLNSNSDGGHTTPSRCSFYQLSPHYGCGES